MITLRDTPAFAARSACRKWRLRRANAMFAPVTRRFITYDVAISAASAGYCATIGKWQPMIDWIEAAAAEPEEMEELDLEF